MTLDCCALVGGPAGGDAVLVPSWANVVIADVRPEGTRIFTVSTAPIAMPGVRYVRAGPQTFVAEGHAHG